MELELYNIDMTNKEILGFIKQQLKQGASREKITRDLLENGWNLHDIEEGFKEITFPAGILKKSFRYIALHKKLLLYPLYIMLIYFAFLIIPFCHTNTISKNNIFSNEGFFPVDVTYQYRRAVGICAVPDGGTSKPVNFTVSFYEDTQRTKLLAYFDKESLGLHELWNGHIIIFPYSDTEQEVIILSDSGGLYQPDSDSTYFRVNNVNKSVVHILPQESKYVPEAPLHTN
jgi:hypothetical protein